MIFPQLINHSKLQLFRHLNQDKSHVDNLRSQQPVTVCRHRQLEFTVRRLLRLGTKLKFIQHWRDLRFSEWPLKSHVHNWNWADRRRRLRLENQLETESATHRVDWILRTVVVDAAFDAPLKTESREAIRLIEELREEVVSTVGL